MKSHGKWLQCRVTCCCVLQWSRKPLATAPETNLWSLDQKRIAKKTSTNRMWNKCLAHRAHSTTGDHRRIDGWPIIKRWTGKAPRVWHLRAERAPRNQLLRRRGHVNLLSSPSVPVEMDPLPIKVTPCHFRGSCLEMLHSTSHYTVAQSWT